MRTPLKYNNLGRMKNTRIPSHYTNCSIAYVMIGYGFTDANIRDITALEDRIIRSIRTIYKGHFNPDSSHCKKQTQMPRSILSGEMVPVYSQLIDLYLLHHSGNPREKIDIEAVLFAWNVLQAHYMRRQGDQEALQQLLRKLDINNFLSLCRSLLGAFTKHPDADFTKLIYSRADHFYFANSVTMSDATESAGFCKSRPLTEILAALTKKKGASRIRQHEPAQTEVSAKASPAEG